MKKAVVCLALLFLAIVLPSLSFTEDQETVLLARAVYAVARDESYEAKLAVASAALNRVDDPWHPNTLRGVLEEKHQFPIGSYYDAESLRAAHEALAGRRNLPADVMYFQSTGARAGKTLLYKTWAGFLLHPRRQPLNRQTLRPHVGAFFCGGNTDGLAGGSQDARKAQKQGAVHARRRSF